MMVSERELQLARMRAALESGEDLDEGPELPGKENTAERRPVARRRPTGESVMYLGSVGIGGGVLMALYGALDEAMWALFLGGALANLGTIAVVSGYIVNAISFLPSKRK